MKENKKDEVARRQRLASIFDQAYASIRVSVESGLIDQGMRFKAFEIAQGLGLIRDSMLRQIDEINRDA